MPVFRSILFLAGILIFGYGWWKIRFSCKSEKQWWVGLCAALIGASAFMYGFDGLFDWWVTQ